MCLLGGIKSGWRVAEPLSFKGLSLVQNLTSSWCQRASFGVDAEVGTISSLCRELGKVEWILPSFWMPVNCRVGRNGQCAGIWGHAEKCQQVGKLDQGKSIRSKHIQRPSSGCVGLMYHKDKRLDAKQLSRQRLRGLVVTQQCWDKLICAELVRYQHDSLILRLVAFIWRRGREEGRSPIHENKFPSKTLPLGIFSSRSALIPFNCFHVVIFAFIKTCSNFLLLWWCQLEHLLNFMHEYCWVL